MPDIQPHWHDQNPWNDHLIYVPLDELAECCAAIGKTFAQFLGTPMKYEPFHMIQHWQEYGSRLDGYILTGPIVTAGIRFGPGGDEYLSPGFHLPKLAALLKKYRNQQRKTA